MLPARDCLEHGWPIRPELAPHYCKLKANQTLPPKANLNKGATNIAMTIEWEIKLEKN